MDDGRVMLRLLACLLACLLLLPGCSALSAPEPEGPLTGERLVEALRDGGLVLYLRHTHTTEDGTDDLAHPQRCAGQRELTERGRQEARAMGIAFRSLDLPVGRVVASPICRTKETAVLAFGRAQTDRALLPVPDDASAEQLAPGRRLLSTRPADGTNVVLVGHISNVRPLTGATPDEGGTVLFRPDGDGGFTLVAEVPPQGWQRLAAGQGATGSCPPPEVACEKWLMSTTTNSPTALNATAPVGSVPSQETQTLRPSRRSIRARTTYEAPVSTGLR